MGTDAKKALKGIVRECLMEILAEGLGNNLNESMRRGSSVSNKKVPSKTKKKIDEQKNINSKLQEAVALATDDELMRSILMDTAQTTLQEQLRNEIPNHVNGAMQMASAQVDNGVDLNDLFKEASTSWNAITQRIDEKKNR
jgi:hypothetical protein